MITTSQLITQITEQHHDPELEEALLEAIHTSGKVTPELLETLADIMDVYDGFQLGEAEVLSREADVLDNLALELETVALESRADELDALQELLDSFEIASPAQTNPSSQALPTPSIHEKDELDAVRDQLKALTNTQ